jgi:hypothetical protein
LRAIAESLSAENPGNVNAEGFLALAQARAGDSAAAMRTATMITGGATTRVGTNTAPDWHAAIAAALGHKADALAYLQRGYSGGLPDFSWHGSIVYELLRDYPPFQEYIRPKG